MTSSRNTCLLILNPGDGSTHSAIDTASPRDLRPKDGGSRIVSLPLRTDLGFLNTLAESIIVATRTQCGSGMDARASSRRLR